MGTANIKVRRCQRGIVMTRRPDFFKDTSACGKKEEAAAITTGQFRRKSVRIKIIQEKLIFS